MKNKAVAVFFAFLIGLAAWMMVLDFGPENEMVAEAESGEPTTSENWLDDTHDPLGREVFTNAPAADWVVENGDDLWYEDVTLSLTRNMYILGGTVTLVNTTLWVNGAHDDHYNIYNYGGNFTLINSSIEHKGRRNASVDSYMFGIMMDDRGNDPIKGEFKSCNMTMYNSSINSTRLVGFATPATESNLLVYGGNFTSYFSSIECPEQYYGSDENITFVNSKVVGNHSFNDTTTTLNWVNYHTITFHDNNTALIDITFSDSEGTAMTITNGSYPSNMHISPTYLYHPDEYAFWFARTNRTEIRTGVTNSTNSYPWTASIDKPATWTTNTLYTLKECAPRECSHGKFLDDMNQSLGNWNVTEVDEDAYTSKVLRTTSLSFSTTDVGFLLRAPVDIDYSKEWAFGTNNGSSYHGWEDKGANSLDYVRLSANAGNDFTVQKGSNHQFDGTGSTAENAKTNYTWTITNSSGSTVATLYGSRPLVRVNLSAGEYPVSLRVKDDELASDADEAIMTVTDPTSNGTTTGTSVITTTGWDWWSSPWWRSDIWKFWEGQWWEEVWDETVDFVRSDWGVVIILGLVLFAVVETMTDVSLIKTFGKLLKRG